TARERRCICHSRSQRGDDRLKTIGSKGEQCPWTGAHTVKSVRHDRLGRARGANLAARGLQQWAHLCWVLYMLSSSLGCLASLVILLLSAAPPATAGDFRSGLSAYNSGDYVTAFRDWYPLAEHGDGPAEAALGFLFHKGLGVAQDDVEAASWFEKAARKGQAEAQLLLGTLYFFGEGVQQNYVMAFAWCEIAQSH